MEVIGKYEVKPLYSGKPEKTLSQNIQMENTITTIIITKITLPDALLEDMTHLKKWKNTYTNIDRQLGKFEKRGIENE